ncbi:MAG: hypothetical protein ACPF8V_04370 [Luteibaculum sp.]
MKTQKEKNIEIFKTVAIVLLLVGTTVAGSIAYKQTQKNAELEQRLVELGADIDGLNADNLEAFREIEANLASISKHEGNIRETESLEGIEDPKERIKMEIAAIEKLVAKNNEIIAQLNKTVDGKNGRLAAYKKEVGQLKTRIDEYKATLEELEMENNQLAANLQGQVERNKDLENTIQETEKVLVETEKEVNKLDKSLHRAYYTVGDFKELKDKSIVTKEGGILGIASAKQLNPELNPKSFTEIDLRFLKKIPVFKKNAEIVTAHDPSSYEVKSDGNTVEWIEIKNPELFWQNSKYLVVVTKDGWI